MEENNNVETTPVVEEPIQTAVVEPNNEVQTVEEPAVHEENKPKKKGPILVIVLLVIVALGVGGYICYDKFIAKKPETNNTKKADDKKEEEIPADEPEEEAKTDDGKVSKESILKLAKDKSKYINADFNYIHEWNIFDDVIADNFVHLTVKDGTLYLEAEGKKSKVSNLDERVVQVLSSDDGCDDTVSALVLTEEGNLYSASIYKGEEPEIEVISGLLDSIKQNKDVELIFTKINSEQVKVLGVTTLNGDSRGTSCGFDDVIVYCNDSAFRSSRDFHVYNKLITDYYDGFSTEGFVVFNDKTISINGKDIVKGKNNADLIIKAAFDNDEEDIVYIIGEDNYVYVESGQGNAKIKLYMDSKIKTQSLITDDNDSSNNKVDIEFENGKSIHMEGANIGQF